jgi:fibronectin type 3 domain-containing protein
MRPTRRNRCLAVLAVGLTACAIDDPPDLGSTQLEVALPAPANLQLAIISTTGVQLTWDASPGATKYVIQRGSTPGSETTFTSAAAAATTWRYNHLEPSTTYCWVVRNLNASGELSAASNEVCGSTSSAPLPPVPAGVTATATALTRIQLAWTPSAGASSYRIYAAPSPSTPMYTGTVLDPTATFTAVVTPNTAYGFQVEAVSAAGASARSPVVTASTAGLRVPTGVAAEAVATTRIIVTWDPVPNAQSYEVFAAPSPAAPVQVGTVTAPTTTFRHDDLTPSTSYGYQVRAQLREGRSALSTPIATATTFDSVPPGQPPPTGSCRSGWCWVYPRPEGNTFASIWGASDSDVWAIGANGTLARYLAGTWIDYSDPSQHWQTTRPELWGTGATDVWASVGFDGVRRWNGSSWSTVAAGVAYAGAIGGTGASDVWVHDQNRQNARHWNGTSWTTRPMPAGWTAKAFGGSTPGAALLVSDNGELARWNGSAWTIVSSSRRNTARAVVLDDTHVVAVGSGFVDFWDGTTWVRRPPVAGRAWSEIAARSVDDLWVAAWPHPLIRTPPYHWDGSAWTAIDDPDEPLATAPRWASPGGALWTVGSGGVVKVWNGSTWSPRSSGRNTVFATWGTSDADIWIVLRDELVADAHHTLHWNGVAWQEVAFPFQTTFPSSGGYAIHDIWGSAADDYWIGAGLSPGNQRYLIQWNGTAWSRTGPFGVDPAGGAVGFTDLWGTARDNVYAVAAGALYHFDGVAWTQDTRVPGGSRVFGSDSSDVYVINRADLWRWDGTAWSRHVAPRPLGQGWANSPSDVWLAGDGNLHFDGTTFRSIDTPGSRFGGPLGTVTEMFTFKLFEMTRWSGGIDGTPVRMPAFFVADRAWLSPSGRLYAAGAGLIVFGP